MDKYSYLVAAQIEDTKNSIMLEVEDLLQAKNNEPGVIYGQANQEKDGSYSIDLHMGGTLFRLMHRPQLRLRLQEKPEGCMLSASLAQPWVDWGFHLVLIFLSFFAALAFYGEGQQPKFVMALIAMGLFMFSLFTGFYRAKAEINSMLDYMQQALRDVENPD